jgi:hypothetical protein
MSRDEARVVVAAFILSQPTLQATMRRKERRAEMVWGLMRWLILFQAIAVAIGYFIFSRDQWWLWNMSARQVTSCRAELDHAGLSRNPCRFEVSSATGE